jgi:hypothetical protein
MVSHLFLFKLSSYYNNLLYVPYALIKLSLQVFSGRSTLLAQDHPAPAGSPAARVSRILL